MADLKTNYVDDVLDTTKNQLRKYQQIQNDDGTVSFVDVTEYTQVGTSFGAKDINDTNAAINDVNGKLIVEYITVDAVALKPSAFACIDLDASKDGYSIISAFMDVPANSADVQYSVVRHPTIPTILRIQGKNNTSTQTTFGGTICVTYMKN